MESKNYYDILEVSVKASAQEITLAKNKLAKRYHPDVNMRNGIDTTDKMQEILEAYLVLSDPAKRAEYDREIRGNRPSKMQTFNLYEESEEVEDPDHPTFVTYWKAAGALYDIIEQSNALFHQRKQRRPCLVNWLSRHCIISFCCAKQKFRSATGIRIL